MNSTDLLALLRQVAGRALSPEEAAASIKIQPFMEMLDGVTIDCQRRMRTGMGEAVFGAGKSVQQIEQAVAGLAAHGEPVLVTKLDEAKGRTLADIFKDGQWWPKAGLFSLGRDLPLHEPWPSSGQVMIVTAGASDLPVALEALGAASFMGLDAGLVSDVGVAGLHRLAPHLPTLAAAAVLIVVAGMEGALPSVLAGLVDRPVLCVPTSVGYGTSFHGLTALLSMLNSCAPGLAVLNIDNGFGAAAFAAKLILPPA